ncbi:sulfite exporter TauE/SafE family protein [Chromobacterium vaccinii]|uniref:sulfite exporter TauE/SafE family protein n=1 Tax=Chromobacterium vaccinii TaxID=1108595 RepID=UPI001E3188F4|nr:sulfite exporter TauE/SafE family protein [Chromobacterium vaccinii]MCD4486104.1 sulfite exporter TauE/SafE family protein [Chromobacterium vaccinii]
MLSIELWAVLLACGAVAGFLAGLLGVGGGLIIVPVVLAVLSAAHLGGEHAQHLAVGTSLAVMVFTSLSSVRAHHKKGAVDWRIVRGMAPAMVAGTLLGSLIAGWISGLALRWFFVAYAYAVALQMLAGRQPKGGRGMPGWAGQGAAGSVIGMISSWVGIGGGSMSVPFMSWCNVPVHTAIATSAALGWPIAVSGAVGYLYSGWGAAGLPPGAMGFVYLPAMLALMLMTVLLAPVGAKAAHRLPVPKLKKAFAVLMAAMASEMLYSLLRG